MFDRVSPVSYTHLDVYKRQVLKSPHPKLFATSQGCGASLDVLISPCRPRLVIGVSQRPPQLVVQRRCGKYRLPLTLPSSASGPASFGISSYSGHPPTLLRRTRVLTEPQSSAGGACTIRAYIRYQFAVAPLAALSAVCHV